MTDAVNCALHVSVNSGTDSEVEVTVDRSLNTSVHLRYMINLLRLLTTTIVLII